MTQNLMRTSWTKPGLMIIFHEDPTSSISVILLTDRQMVMKTITPW